MHLTALCSTMHVVTFGSDIMCSLKKLKLSSRGENCRVS